MTASASIFDQIRIPVRFSSHDKLKQVAQEVATRHGLTLQIITYTRRGSVGVRDTRNDIIRTLAQEHNAQAEVIASILNISREVVWQQMKWMAE